MPGARLSGLARKLTLAVALFLAGACGGIGSGGTPCTSCSGSKVNFINVDSCRCCGLPGSACTTDSDCCAGCSGGKCGCLAGPSDGSVLSICGNAKVCCSGRCDSPNGFCQ